MKDFDLAKANLWLGIVLLALAGINVIQGERVIAPLIVIGLCNLAIGAAARKKQADNG